MIEAVAIGVAAGALAGMLGVGGGILFVPGLVLFVGLHQVDAEATSLLAIVPTALVGALRQRRYGNVRVHDARLLGLLSALGAVAGVALANIVPTRGLEIGFGVLSLAIAIQLMLRALREGGSPRDRRRQTPRGGAQSRG